jgi:hypothetical protein
LYLGHDEESIVAVGTVGDDRLIHTVLGELHLCPSRISYSQDFGFRTLDMKKEKKAHDET